MQVEIVLSDNKELNFAKEELEYYLSKMLSSSDSFKFYLEIEKTVNDNDSFIIEVGNNIGLIKGNSERSVLLGIYNYLHKVGVRFLAPGRKHEYIPKITTDKLNISYSHISRFKHRGVCIEGATSYENIIDFIDWLPKVGYNAFFLQFKAPYSFLERWYNHRLNPHSKPEDYDIGRAISDMEKIENEIKKRNLLLHKVGHGWTGESLGFPTFDWSMTNAELSKENIELCAEIDGVRGLYEGMPANTNLCYSNKRAKEKFVSLVVDYVKEHDNIDYLHVWLADAFNNICECDNCESSTVADFYVDYLNEVDKRLTDIKSNTKIVFLLYQELLWRPIKERLNNPSRFVMMFAPISRTFEKSYDIPDSIGELPKYVKNKIELPTDIGENLSFLKSWQEIFKGDSFLYDYPLGRAHYGDFGYINISRVIYEDVNKLKDLKLDGYISCQELRVCMPNALPNYILGYSLMEENVSFDDLVDEYYEAMYADNKDEVLSFTKTLSKLSSPDYINGKGERVNDNIANKMKKIIEICEEFKNKEMSIDSNLNKIFIKILRYHCDYIIKFATAIYYLSIGEKDKALEYWNDMKDFICKNEAEYQDYLDVFRVIEVSKRYTGFIKADENVNYNTWHD